MASLSLLAGRIVPLRHLASAGRTQLLVLFARFRAKNLPCGHTIFVPWNPLFVHSHMRYVMQSLPKGNWQKLALHFDEQSKMKCNGKYKNARIT